LLLLVLWLELLLLYWGIWRQLSLLLLPKVLLRQLKLELLLQLLLWLWVLPQMLAIHGRIAPKQAWKHLLLLLLQSSSSCHNCAGICRAAISTAMAHAC
jgi:hypothetical protein